ncbi:hypothetical protein MPLA_590011 [Mesorhizobium sp. ORS 3359]|nr:hypothetical protein MPLA_590011 [Mesorhizobium sp. ORS 3359]
MGAPEVWLACSGDWRKWWDSQSPSLWEKCPAGQRGRYLASVSKLGFLSPAKARERWPRSGRRGRLSQGASLSASVSPSRGRDF